MANRITTAIDFVTDGTNRSLAGLKGKIAEAEGASNKLKAGWGGVTDMFKNSAGAQSAAIAAGTAAIGYSINAASDLAESINAVDVSYGEAAEGVHELGKASAETLGMSERAFNTFAVQFSAFAQQIAKESGRDVVEVLDEITTRTADFASVNNLAMEEAGTIVMSTLAGETEAFRRYGGDVSAATVKTYAYANGIAEAGSELTEQQKVLARYGALMEQTDKVAGDFANTSDGLANQQRITAARTEDLAAAIGTKLMPIAADALQSINDLADAVTQLNTETGGSLEWLFNTSGLQGIEALQEIVGKIKGNTVELTDAQRVAGAELANLTQEWLTGASAADQYDGATDRAAARVARLAEEVTASVPAHQQVEQAIADATTAMEEQNEAARELRRELAETAERVYDLHDAELDLEHKVRDAVIALNDEKTTLREARSAIEDVTEAADAQAKKKLELNGITVDSVVGQQMWAESMLATANTMGGPLRDEILRYVSEVTGIPSEVLTQFTPEMDFARLAEIEAALEFTKRTRFVRFQPETGGVAKYADGTYNAGGGMSVINDGNGPELVTLPNGSKVMTAANTANYLNQTSGGGGGESIVVNNKTINQYIQVTGDAESVLYEAGRRARYME